MNLMTMRRRLAILIPLAIIVGCGLGLAAIATYFNSRPNLPGTVGHLPPPEPLIGTFLFKYWYIWPAIAAGWVGVAYLGYRTLGMRAQDGPGENRAFKIMIGAELASIIATLGGYAALLYAYA